ncbi:LysR family transcriptional regulator [Methylobacterium sp. ID0610]|uniref:LysR family transcriptional regulator n=1 Tax=Methylobacterium carpenticola TaxID=3344827 RepID=UPI003674C624
MIAPRRFLPSIRSLLALEAVDRLGGASAAAQDLSLTHSAVSRQLKVLEEQIGVALLVRQGRHLTLTPAGADYARAVRACLQDLARASLKLRASGSQDALSLAILPAFGTHWLGPRLARFAGRHPEVVVHLSTRLAPFDFAQEKFDAAIHYGARDWPGVAYLELAQERVVPACAPGLLAQAASDPAALLRLPLLHLDSRPGAWEEWFEAQGCRADDLRGMLFDQFTTMAEAAALGLGVALLPDFLAEKEIAAGRLIRAFPQAVATPGRYYLVWPSLRRPNTALDRFIAWLRASPS